jgi:hypothetical protein
LRIAQSFKQTLRVAQAELDSKGLMTQAQKVMERFAEIHRKSSDK